jgi:protein-tyrosine-phosphatase
MARRGIDSIASHRSRKVDAAQIAAADLILTMTGLHRGKLHSTYAEEADKIFLLSEYAGVTGDVADPVGGSLAEYRMCADELDSLIAASLERILALAGKEPENGEK